LDGDGRLAGKASYCSWASVSELDDCPFRRDVDCYAYQHSGKIALQVIFWGGPCPMIAPILAGVKPLGVGQGVRECPLLAVKPISAKASEYPHANQV
jgi:hypothetical protein